MDHWITDAAVRASSDAKKDARQLLSSGSKNGMGTTGLPHDHLTDAWPDDLNFTGATQGFSRYTMLGDTGHYRVGCLGPTGAYKRFTLSKYLDGCRLGTLRVFVNVKHLAETVGVLSITILNILRRDLDTSEYSEDGCLKCWYCFTECLSTRVFNLCRDNKDEGLSRIVSGQKT